MSRSTTSRWRSLLAATAVAAIAVSGLSQLAVAPAQAAEPDSFDTDQHE